MSTDSSSVSETLMKKTVNVLDIFKD
jgi:hypothetical protein